MSITEWKNYFRGTDREAGLLSLLAKVPVFSGLTDAERRRIREMMHIREFQDSEVVFYENQPASGMYVITRGAVRIVLRHGQPDEILLVRLEAGDFFGELSLLDGAPRSATVIADGATELGGFFKPDLMDIIERRPRQGVKIVMALGEVLAERLRHTNAELRKAQKSQDGPGSGTNAGDPH